MAAALRTAQLTSDRVIQAYPLIREVAPNLSLAEWVDFARPLSGQKGETGGCRGIIIAERSRYIRGLFIYEVNPDLSHGRALFARNIIVLDLVQRDAVAEALVDAMERLAQTHGCGAVHVHLSPLSEWALQCFERRGHRVQGYHLCSRLEEHEPIQRQHKGASARPTPRRVC